MSCRDASPLTLDTDLLVLGTGRRAKQLAPELARQLHEMGVRVDAMDTVSAAAALHPWGRMWTHAVLAQPSAALVALGGPGGDQLVAAGELAM